MQIDRITSVAGIPTQTGTLAATAQISANGKPQSAVVERTPGGYEAYLPQRIGPVATGSAINIAEARLSSTVQFQA